MKHCSGFHNVFKTETWHFWGNMMVFLRYLDEGLGTKSLRSDPADKTVLGLHIVSIFSKWSNIFLKMGQKRLSLAPAL